MTVHAPSKNKGLQVEMLKKTTRAYERRLPYYMIVLLYLTLPNLLLLLATHVLGALPHGYINLDFLLIGALGVFLPRSAVFMLLFLDSLADFAHSICYTYDFSLENLLSSLQYLPLLPKSRILEGLALLALSVLLCAALASLRPSPQHRLWTAGILLGWVVIFSLIDILSGRNPSIWRVNSDVRDVVAHFNRVARSPGFTLLGQAHEEAVEYFEYEEPSKAVVAPMASASSKAISFLDSRPASAEAPNVVLIVVESWGLALDSHLAQELTAPYDDPRIAQKYNVSYGSVPFTGNTVPAEARELCQSNISFGIIRHTTQELVEKCLPAYFHARGYQALAIHGFSGGMFHRSKWYPVLGFDRIWFGPDLTKIGLPDCRGAFPGICDASIAAWIGSSFLFEDHGKPKFIHWMTLNSHLPVPANPDLPDDGVCATVPELRNSKPLCTWFRLVRAVHQSVQQVALGPTARPTVFVLVGDHAPPFGDPQLLADFSGTQVPYVMLTPLAAATR